MFSQIGPMEIAVVLVLALIVLGPKRLPEAGRSLGRGLREFTGSLTSPEEPHSDAATAAPSAPAVAAGTEAPTAETRSAT